MYYVYLIQNESGERYIGYTSDLKKRLKAHNENPKGYTSKRKTGEWELKYYEAYRCKEDAMEREKKLKMYGNALKQVYKRAYKSLNDSEC